MKYPAILITIKQKYASYRAISRDPRTPKFAQVCLVLALAYLLSPIDLIPDFIPVVGFLDDLVIVVGLVLLAQRCIPEVVLREHLRATEDRSSATDADV